MTKKEKQYQAAVRALNAATYKAWNAARSAGQPSKVFLKMAWETDTIVDNLEQAE